MTEIQGVLSRVVSAYHAHHRECIEGDDPDEQVRAATRLAHRIREAESALEERAVALTERYDVQLAVARQWVADGRLAPFPTEGGQNGD